MLPEEIADSMEPSWVRCLDGAVTVCDRNGIIVYMNQRSADQFQKYGGSALVGKNLLNCHPEPARTKLVQMLKNPEDNLYTTEKGGKKKIIIQKPWMEDGTFMGVVEMSFVLPEKMAHFKRD